MLTLDNATAADLVAVPALLVHGETDDACPLAQAVHIGLYDDETYLAPAIAAVVEFLDGALSRA